MRSESASRDRQVDHRDALFLGWLDDTANLQMLCVGCHREKTANEQASFVDEGNPLLSRFSLEAYREFVESPKPPQIVASMKEKGDDVISVDIVRSRYSAFVHSDGAEIPIFSPMDSPKPAVPGELGDFMYIDMGPLRPQQSPRSVMPYFGGGWYGRPR